MKIEEITSQCISWIKDWFSKNGNDETKAVVAISGGKDSSITAKLLCEALGKDRVVGVTIPCGEQVDIEDSEKIIKELGIKSYSINIGAAYDSISSQMVSAFEKKDKSELPDGYTTNTPARLRMAVTYGVAAMIGNCRVANTCNRSEGIVGYDTIYGDLAGDFAPLRFLTVDEIVKMGDYLKLPKDLVHKVPSDGMSLKEDGSLKSDEEKLGLKYGDIDFLIRNKTKKLNKKTIEEIEKRYNENIFKHGILHIPSYIPIEPDYFLSKFGR